MLFRLFKEQQGHTNLMADEVFPGLYTFEGEPMLYRKLRRPFRVRIIQDGTDQRQDEFVYLRQSFWNDVVDVKDL